MVRSMIETKEWFGSKPLKNILIHGTIIQKARSNETLGSEAITPGDVVKWDANAGSNYDYVVQAGNNALDTVGIVLEPDAGAWEMTGEPFVPVEYIYQSGESMVIAMMPCVTWNRCDDANAITVGDTVQCESGGNIRLYPGSTSVAATISSGISFGKALTACSATEGTDSWCAVQWVY